jgi:hypothetical protein
MRNAVIVATPTPREPFLVTTLDQLQYLQSEEGTALLAAIREFDPQPNSGLAVISQLRKSYLPEMVAAGMTIHQLRVRAREKFTRAELMWFTRDGFEQATSESISRYRAERFASHTRIVDMCCGIGGDSLALAQLPTVESLTIVDRDPVHLAMAESNTRVYAPHAPMKSILGNVEDVDLSGADAIFIDPARRDDQGRHATGKSEPPLEWCIELAAKIPAVGIKLAPGLPHRLIPASWEFETIAIRFDLKEAILWSPAMSRSSWRASVVTASGTASFVPQPGDPVGVQPPAAGDWLFDPNPAITRAGLVDDLARTLNANKIDDQIAFLTASAPTQTPFARCFRVLASMPWHERNLRQAILDLEGGEVVIRRRGLAGNVDEIQRRLRGTGSRSLFLAMTRLQDRPWAIVCENHSPG